MTWYLGLVIASFAAFSVTLGFYSIRAMLDDARARASAAKRVADPHR
jgi:hypothetical protein